MKSMITFSCLNDVLKQQGHTPGGDPGKCPAGTNPMLCLSMIPAPRLNLCHGQRKKTMKLAMILEQRGNLFWIVTGVFLALLIGTIDYLTGI